MPKGKYTTAKKIDAGLYETPSGVVRFESFSRAGDPGQGWWVYIKGHIEGVARTLKEALDLKWE